MAQRGRQAFYTRPVTVAALLTLLALCGAALLLLTRPAQRGPSTFRPPARRMMKTEEEVWLRKLMTVTLGNRGAIERGVTAKRRKFPRATRAELLEMVHDEYLRDRSRN